MKYEHPIGKNDFNQSNCLFVYHITIILFYIRLSFVQHGRDVRWKRDVAFSRDIIFTRPDCDILWWIQSWLSFNTAWSSKFTASLQFCQEVNTTYNLILVISLFFLLLICYLCFQASMLLLVIILYIKSWMRCWRNRFVQSSTRFSKCRSAGQNIY